MSKKPVVDYMDLIARAAAEERAERDQESILPEQAGARVVDYMAVSKAWKDQQGRMEHQENDIGN